MKTHLITALAILAMASPAAAQSPRWSVSFNAGADVPLTGDVHAGGSGRVLALPTSVEARDYDAIYGKPFTWSADVGFLAMPNTEVRGRVFRTRGEAERVQVGTVATLPLFAEFDPYAATGVDGGVRQYLASPDSAVRPFVGGSLGMVRVDAINSTFSVPAASVTLRDVPMYKSSTVLSMALSAGAMVPLGSNLGFQAGVDFRWHGDLEESDGLAGTGLEPINDESRRWSMPITAGVVVRF